MAPNYQNRWDAADSAFITQQLQSYDRQERYKLVPGIVGRKYIAPIEGVSPNLPSYKYTMTTVTGSAKRNMRGTTKDAPGVKVVTEEMIHSIKTFDAEASWTVDEVRASREVGANLDMKTLLAAQVSIEQQIDSALCSGVSGTNITGLANNAAIIANGVTNAAGAWSSATTDAIIADVAKMISDTSTALKQAQVPGNKESVYDQFTLFMPVYWYQKLDMTLRGSVNDSSILSILRRFSSLKAIIPWWRLDTANAGNAQCVLVPALDNGAVNPMAVGGLLPMDWEMLPEQYSGRTVTVPCAGKCGGVVIPYPVACRYLRGI